jgi:hypothetical protein
MLTYLDIRTDETKHRHTDWGNVPVLYAENSLSVGNSQSELEKALKEVEKSGAGKLHLVEDIYISSPLRWVSNLWTVGGSIRATKDFKGSYMLDVRNVRNSLFDSVEIDGNGTSALGMTIRNTYESAWINCNVHHCRTGIYIEDESSDLLFMGGESHHNHIHHGLAIDDKRCKRIAVIGMRLHHNAAFGFDTHSTEGELAGCIIEYNGQDKGGYSGACIKLPEAHNWLVHDSTLRNDGGKYGCVWNYEIERAPSGVKVYRCDIIGGPHFYAGKNGEILHCDNRFFDVNGDPTDMERAGPGKVVEDVTLRGWPDLVIDDPEPRPGPVEEYITRQEALLLFRELFAEEIEKVRISYDA